MANPQKENGFTPIANELLEALMKFRPPAEKRAIFDSILRRTYGYGRKEAAISGDYFAQLTNINRRHVARAIKWLEQANMITATPAPRGRGSISTYAIQKDYDLWQLPGLDPQKVQLNAPDMVHFNREEEMHQNNTENAPSPAAENAPKQAHTKEIKKYKESAGSASACLESQASPAEDQKQRAAAFAGQRIEDQVALNWALRVGGQELKDMIKAGKVELADGLQIA